MIIRKAFYRIFILVLGLFIQLSCNFICGHGVINNKKTIINNIEYVNICKWKFGAKACVVFSFDDNCKKHLEIARLFDKYNFKATFFVNSSNMLKDSLVEILKLGHEIGSHCYSHISLTELDSVEVDYQIRMGKTLIDSLLNVDCLSFAEPFHHRSSLTKKIAFNYHLFFRDYSKYSDLKHYVLESNTELENNYRSALDDAITYGRLLQISGHSIDGEGYKSIKKELLRSILDTIDFNVKENNIWITTNKEAIQYENLFKEIVLDKNIKGDTLILNFKNYNACKYDKMPTSQISVEFSNVFTKKIVPLTDSISRVIFKDKTVYTIDLKRDTCVYFKFESNTDYNDVVLSDYDCIYPNPARDYLNLRLKGEVVTLAIYDINGVIQNTEIENLSRINIADLKKGEYFLRIFIKDHNVINKLNYLFLKN